MVENRVLRGVFVLKREEVTGGGENCIMKSSKICVHHQILSRGGLVSTLMGYKLQGIRFLAGQRDLSVFVTHRRALASSQPPIEWVPGAEWPTRESDLSPSSSVEVQN